jgi:hypothetical protein
LAAAIEPEPTLTTVNCGGGGGDSALRRDRAGYPDHSRLCGPAARHASKFGVYPIANRIVRHAEPCAQPHITATLAVQQSNFADDLGGQLPLPLPSPNRGERAKANRPSGVRDASCTAPFGAMRCSTALYRAYVVLTLRGVYERSRIGSTAPPWQVVLTAEPASLDPIAAAGHRTHRHRRQSTCPTTTGAPARATIQH